MMIGENCEIMQWAALLGAISTTFLDNNNNNNNNNNSLLIHKIKKLHLMLENFQFLTELHCNNYRAKLIYYYYYLRTF